MNDSDQYENHDNTMSSLGWGSSTTEDIIYLATRDTIVDDEIGRFSRPLLTFAAITTIIIMMVGIFGNLLTILALLKCPKVRNVAAAFIISLCLADCLFCAIVLPFSAFRFIQGTWTHGDILCQLIPFIQYGNIGVSLLCIAMITINRYIMITHHNGYARIYKRHWIGAMIAFCWLFAYGMQLPTLFGIWGTFGFDSKLGTCSIMADKNGNSSKTALFIIAFVIPCIIIIGCYTKIFWVVHRSEVRLRQHANNQNSIPNNLRQIPSSAESNENSNRLSLPVSSSSCSTASGVEGMKYGTSSKTIRVKDQRDIKAKRNEWRITKMVLAIFLSFVVCYLPITVVKVADKDVYLPGWHIFGYIMLYLSACINPIIYVIMNKQYRKAYKTVLMCQPSRLLPFTNPGSSAGEKWKDTGCSYKHSHTIVSQVLVADIQTSSNSYSSNQTPIVLELSPQTMTSLPNSMTMTIPSDHPSNDRTTVNIKKKTVPITPSLNTTTDYIPPNLLTGDTLSTFKGDNHQLMNANSNSVIAIPEPQQIYTKPLDGTLFQGSPIILSEGDIIVEEEKEDLMEEENWDQTSSTTFQTNPFKMPANIGNVAKELKNLRIVEKDAQYKQDYKQNTNVIPDSNSKISSKSNILVD